MDDLFELVELINKNKTNRIEVLGLESNRKSKVQGLYDLLSIDKTLKDKNLAEHFYPDIPEEVQSKYFSNLKGRLKRRLINTLFVIGLQSEKQKSNPSANAYKEVIKNLAAIRLLISLGLRQSAIPLAKKSFKVALKYELIDMALELSRILSRHYSTIEGDIKRFLFFQDRVHKIKRLYDLELEVEEMYTKIIVYSASKRWNDPALRDMARGFCQNLEEKGQEKNTTYRFQFLYFLVLAVSKELDNDYRALIRVCDQALEAIKEKPHILVTSHRFYFIFKKLASHIYLRNTETADQLIEECLENSVTGQRNWYITLEYATRNAFYAGQYDKAYDWIQKAVNNPGFKKQSSNIRENWVIFQASVYYLFALGKLNRPIGDVTKRFRLSKFMNEVPLFSKDKRGLNVAILIFQMLILLVEKKYADIIDRAEPLKAYASRHVHRNANYRSNFFIKFLLKIPDGNFNRKNVSRKTDHFYKKLQEMPIEMSNQSVELEIIPYELLWEMVLETLD